MVAEKPDVRVACPGCGSLDSGTFYSGAESKRMRETGECFTCAFWELKALAGEPLVIDGRVYGVGPEPVPGARQGFLGMGGRRFDVEMFDGRKFTTHNLWSGGEIPERFRDRLPNTARFLGARVAVVGGVTCWDPSPASAERYPPWQEIARRDEERIS